MCQNDDCLIIDCGEKSMKDDDDDYQNDDDDDFPRCRLSMETRFVVVVNHTTPKERGRERMHNRHESDPSMLNQKTRFEELCIVGVVALGMTLLHWIVVWLDKKQLKNYKNALCMLSSNK